MSIHVGLTAGRWWHLTLAEQLGNIGSEVARVIRRRHGNQDSFQSAFDRMLELIDLTITDPRWSSGRRELTRVREVLCDFFVGDNALHSDSTSLQTYFDRYALAARKGR